MPQQSFLDTGLKFCIFTIQLMQKLNVTVSVSIRTINELF